jgi:diadenosine tetraphosphate (Ap4A) HIT family hydrolase
MTPSPSSDSGKIDETSQSGRNDVQPGHPFLSSGTQKPLVALKGQRNGYIMLAPSRETEHYDTLSDEALLAARAWATRLEQLGSSRAYWIILSEVTRHLHIHLFPRWPEDTLSGVPLFESRDTTSQPTWQEDVISALLAWAEEFQVEVL